MDSPVICSIFLITPRHISSTSTDSSKKEEEKICYNKLKKEWYIFYRDSKFDKQSTIHNNEFVYFTHKIYKIKREIFILKYEDSLNFLTF